MDKNNDSFKKFLEQITKQGKLDIGLQTLQVKYEREMAGEDNDKREEQLKDLNEVFNRIEQSLTGFKDTFDIKTVEGQLQKQTSLLQQLADEQVILRKIGEGSLEYDKASAQYRNASGRELTSVVSGKDIKRGGYVDFETASDRLTGQSNAVKERFESKEKETNNNTIQIKENNKQIEKIIKSTENNSTAVDRVSKNLGKQLSKLSDFKVQEKDKTLTENIKEGIAAYKQIGSSVGGGIKSIGKGIASLYNTGKSAITNPLEFKSRMMGAGNTVREIYNQAKEKVTDVVGVSSDYSVEKERFSKEYAKQMLQKEGESRTERELIKEGGNKYKEVISKEKELKNVENTISEAKKMGFEPAKQDLEKQQFLKESIKQTDPRQDFAPVELKTNGQKMTNLYDKALNQSAESDNITTPIEILSDNSKQELEATKQSLDIENLQLKELQSIKNALAPKTPSELPEQKLKEESQEKEEKKGESGSGFGLSDLAGIGKRAGGALSKGAGALGSGLAKFAGSTGGKLLGGAAAVGLGAYTAYKGYTAAEEQKQASLQEIEAKVKSGEITPEQGEELKKQAADQATENKGGALGKGSGLAAGAIGGAVAGAKLGAFFGPAGVAVGGLAGGALGAFSGSKVGQNIGGAIGKGVAGIKGLFGKQDTNVAPSDQTVSDAQSKAISEYQTSEKELAISKEKIRKFEEENPFDYREKPTSTQEFLGRPGTGKFKDPKKQAEYDKLVQDRESSLDKMDQAKEKYQVSDQTQEYKTTKSGNTFKNVSAPFKKLEVLTGRMGYKKEEFLNDDDSYNASKINAVYEKEMNRELSGKEKVETVPSSGAEVTAKKPDSSTGLTTGKISTENNDMTRELTSKSSTPTPVVTNSVNNVNTTSYVPMKSTPRSDAGGSALERYVSRTSAY